MKSSVFALSAIADSLDQDPDFRRLQVLAERDESADILGDSSPEELTKRWLEILSLVDSYGPDLNDARLQLTAYRCDLRLRGLCAAVERMASWQAAGEDFFEAGELSKLPQMNAEVLQVLCYFFSDLHLRELRTSQLHPSFEFGCKAILQYGVPAAGSKLDAAAQRLKSELSSWLAANGNFYLNLTQASLFLKNIEKWLILHNDVGLQINSKPVEKWFLKLIEIFEVFSNYLDAPVRAGMVSNSGSVVVESADYAVERDSGFRNRILSILPSRSDRSGEKFMEVRNIAFEGLRREDILVLLRGICRWYEVHEPGSPGPYFLQRAVRTMNADFLTILQDLMPESASQFERLAGLGVKK